MPKNILVTGGSGALGGAIVRRFCRDDCSVAFTYRSGRESAEALAKETGARALEADLTDAAQVKALVDQVLQSSGQVDVLVNNAGATQVMPFALIEEADWDEMMGANLKSMFLVTHEVVRDMI
ncbi:MAG: SDR family NAD(P)-dependent oxidoreductase, partial [Planctomycetota bacterium]